MAAWLGLCPGAPWRAYVALTYQDLAGNVKVALSLSDHIQILDRVPPRATATASPSVLWPPDARLVEVTVTATATDDCTATPACRITGVSGFR